MLERLAYLIKTHLPGVFPVIAYAGHWVTVLGFSRRRAEALAEASIQGEVAGQRAVMRPLDLDDLDALQGFIEAMPESHLAYFNSQSPTVRGHFPPAKRALWRRR